MISPPATGNQQPGPTVSPAVLRQQFLEHHEQVLGSALGSALGTVRRYATATQHLLNHVRGPAKHDAMVVDVGHFITYLRAVEVAPNGHANTAKRKLRDKGIKYILETCRSMYRFGQRQGLIAGDRTNPFSAFGLSRLQVRDRKPIFVFSAEQELAFFAAADPWAFAIHFVLAKTGLRPGELVHLLIEDLDLDGGWLTVTEKRELGWSIKTGRERRVSLIAELVELLTGVIGDRTDGPVFLRQQFDPHQAGAVVADRSALAGLLQRRIKLAEREARQPLTRQEHARICHTVWRDSGAVPVDRVRSSFVRIAQQASLPVTCPKSWRHTFATLLQQAGVDVQVRQETLGHKPTDPDRGALGMTGTYTHTSPAFHRQEIERALRLRPDVLEFGRSVTAIGR